MKLKKVLTMGIMAACAVTVWAQTKKPAEVKRPKPIPVYLGNSNLSGGNISKSTFDALLLQGLTSKDSAGRPYKVASFLFTYGERNLYEDSVGNMMWVTDLLSEMCYGDTVTTIIKNAVPGRTKARDTIYFDQILVTSPEGANAIGKGMTFVITK